MTSAPALRLVHTQLRIACVPWVLLLIIIVLITAWAESTRVIVALLANCARLGATELAFYLSLSHLLPLMLIFISLHDKVRLWCFILFGDVNTISSVLVPVGSIFEVKL